MPEPDRRRQILQRHDNAEKPVGLGWIVRRAQLQRHLLFLAEIERLLMAAAPEVPNMQLVTIAAGQQNVRIHTVLHHVWSAPLARNQCVEAKVPPEIVSQCLRSAVDLPLAE